MQRNITLSLSEETLREIKVIAAKRNTSVSALMAKKLQELIDEETGYAKAKKQALALLEQGFSLSTDGAINWSREELHER